MEFSTVNNKYLWVNFFQNVTELCNTDIMKLDFCDSQFKGTPWSTAEVKNGEDFTDVTSDCEVRDDDIWKTISNKSHSFPCTTLYVNKF